MKIEYIKNGDYYIPDLRISEQKNYNINKYGLLKLRYLKENNKTFYSILLMRNELNSYLFSVGNEAKTMVDDLIKSYAKADKLTEKTKENNQLLWVQMMNNYKNMAEEFVLNEFIYN